MLFYFYKDLADCTLDLEALEAFMLDRLKHYSLPSALQYDTEDFNYYDKISHLLMCIVAIDYPYFKDSFVKGEIKLFQQKLKTLSFSEIKKGFSEASEYLDILSQSEECRKLKTETSNQIQLVQNIIQVFLSKSRHSFSKSHQQNCRKYKLTMPFTFPLKLVAKREVEVRNGKVSLSCGRWNELFDIIFDFLLKIEISLIANCNELKKVICNLEDDRLRRIIRRCTDFLSGGFSKDRRIVRANEIDNDSVYFPPCMAGLHQILRRSHRLSYSSRFQYMLFLKDIGLPVTEQISFWENEYKKPHVGSRCTHTWQENAKRYVYQIKHLYGLVGSRGNKTSHPCGTFIQELQSRMDGGCPFQHMTPDQLRKALPKTMATLPDIEDIFVYKGEGLPQKSCAVYLRCLQKVLPGKSNTFQERGTNKNLFFVVSPLQFYRVAKSF